MPLTDPDKKYIDARIREIYKAEPWHYDPRARELIAAEVFSPLLPRIIKLEQTPAGAAHTHPAATTIAAPKTAARQGRVSAADRATLRKVDAAARRLRKTTRGRREPR